MLLAFWLNCVPAVTVVQTADTTESTKSLLEEKNTSHLFKTLTALFLWLLFLTTTNYQLTTNKVLFQKHKATRFCLKEEEEHQTNN